MHLANGSVVLAIDLKGNPHHGEPLHGIVLADNGRQYVVWNATNSDDGWLTFNGDYTFDLNEARKIYDARRIKLITV